VNYSCRTHTKRWSENLNIRLHLLDLSVGWKLLKWIYEKKDVNGWTGLNWRMIKRSMTAVVNPGGECLYQLSNYQIKKTTKPGN
jgi:hypothetical protein